MQLKLKFLDRYLTLWIFFGDGRRHYIRKILSFLFGMDQQLQQRNNQYPSGSWSDPDDVSTISQSTV